MKTKIIHYECRRFLLSIKGDGLVYAIDIWSNGHWRKLSNMDRIAKIANANGYLVTEA